MVLESNISLGTKEWWAPKYTTVLGTPAFVAGEIVGNNIQLFDDQGVLLSGLFSTGHKVSGPIPTMTPGSSDTGLLAVTFSDHAEIRVFEADLLDGSLSELERVTGSSPHSPAVILDVFNQNIVGAANLNGACVAWFDVDYTLNQTSVPTANDVDAPRFFAARTCGASGSATLLVDRTDQLCALSLGADGASIVTTTCLELPGDPLVPPMVVDRNGNGLIVFAFRSSGTNVLINALFASTPAGLAGVDPVLLELANVTLSGSPAMFTGAGTVGLAIPSSSGQLHLVEWNLDFLMVVTTLALDVPNETGSGTPVPGGVIAVRLRADDSSPTFILGDSLGYVHAIRGGAELRDFGWPWLALTGASIRPSPAVAYLGSGTRLTLMVIARRTSGQSTAIIRQLGDNSSWGSGALVWPEYQHDMRSTGCMSLP